MAALLKDAEINEKLKTLSNWTLESNAIKTVKTFDGFPGAIAFVDKLVEPAEAAGHHPDLSISYNKVTISLTSHDAGGLTQQDFDMAKQIEQLT